MKQQYRGRRSSASSHQSISLLVLVAALLVLCSYRQLEVCLTAQSHEGADGALPEQTEISIGDVETQHIYEESINTAGDSVIATAAVEEENEPDEIQQASTSTSGTGIVDDADTPVEYTDEEIHEVGDEGPMLDEQMLLNLMDVPGEEVTTESNQRLLEEHGVSFAFDLTDEGEVWNLINLVRFMDAAMGVCPPFGSPPIQEQRANSSSRAHHPDSHYKLLNPFHSREALAQEFGISRWEALRSAFMTLKRMNDTDVEDRDAPARMDFEGRVALKLSAFGELYIYIPILLHDLHVDRIPVTVSNGAERNTTALRIDMDGATERRNAWLEQVDRVRQQRAVQQVYREKRRKAVIAKRHLIELKRERKKQRREERGIAEGLQAFSLAQRERRHRVQVEKETRSRQRIQNAQTRRNTARCTNIVHAMETLRHTGVHQSDERYKRVKMLLEECEKSRDSPHLENRSRDADPYRCRMFCGGACAASEWVGEEAEVKGVGKDLSVAQVLAIFTSVAVYDCALSEVLHELESHNPQVRNINNIHAQQEAFRLVNLNDWIAERTYDITASDIWNAATHFVRNGGYAECDCPCRMPQRVVAGFKYAYGVMHLLDDDDDDESMGDAASKSTRWAHGYLLIREAAQIGSTAATSFIATAKEHGILTARDPVVAAKLLLDVSKPAASHFAVQSVTIGAPHDADHLLRFERAFNIEYAWQAIDKPMPTVAQIADDYHQSLENAKEESDVRKRLRGTVRAALLSILGIKGVRRDIRAAECLLLSGIRSAGYLCDIEDTEHAQIFVNNGRGGGCVEHRQAFQNALQEHLESLESESDAMENKRLRRFRDVDRTCYPHLSHRYLPDSRESTEALEKALVYLSYIQIFNNASYGLAARYAYLSIQLMATAHEDALSKFKELIGKMERLRTEINVGNDTSAAESAEGESSSSTAADGTESDGEDDENTLDLEDLPKAMILFPLMMSMLIEFTNEIRHTWNVAALMDAAEDFDDMYNAEHGETFDDVYERFMRRSAGLAEDWLSNSVENNSTNTSGERDSDEDEQSTASMLLSLGGVTAPGAYDVIRDPLRSGFIAQESLQLLAISVLGSWRRQRHESAQDVEEDATSPFLSVEKYAMRYMRSQGHTCTAWETKHNATTSPRILPWEECAPRVAYFILLQSALLWRVEGKTENMLDGTINSHHRADPFVLMADMLREGDIRIHEILETSFFTSKQVDRAMRSLLPRKETETERSYAYRLLSFAMERVSYVDPYLYMQRYFAEELKEEEMADGETTSPKFLWERHDYGKAEEHHLPTLRFIRQRTLESHQLTPLLYVSDMHYLLDTEKWTRIDWFANKVWEGIVSFFDYTYEEHLEKRLAREVRVSSRGPAGKRRTATAAVNTSSAFAHHVATLPAVRQYVLGAILLSYTFESGEPQGFSILMMEASSTSRRNVASIRRFTDFVVHDVFLPQAREALWEEHLIAQWNAKKPKTAKNGPHLSLTAPTPFRYSDREDRVEFLATVLRYAADRLVSIDMRRSTRVGCTASKSSPERQDVFPNVEAAFNLLAMCTGVLVHARIEEGLAPLPDSYDGMSFPVGDLNCASALTELIACYDYTPDEKELPVPTLLRHILNTTTSLADHLAEYYAFTGKRLPGILHRFRSSEDDAAKREAAAGPADVTDYHKLVESFRTKYDPDITDNDNNDGEGIRTDDRRLFSFSQRSPNTERFEEIITSASRRRRNAQQASTEESSLDTGTIWNDDKDRAAPAEKDEEEEVMNAISRKRVVEPWSRRILSELSTDVPVPDYGEGLYYNRRIHIITGTRMAASIAKWANWIARLVTFK